MKNMSFSFFALLVIVTIVGAGLCSIAFWPQELLLFTVVSIFRIVYFLLGALFVFAAVFAFYIVAKGK